MISDAIYVGKDAVTKDDIVALSAGYNDHIASATAIAPILDDDTAIVPFQSRVPWKISWLVGWLAGRIRRHFLL